MGGYWSGGEKDRETTRRAFRLLRELAEPRRAYRHRRDLQDVVFDGEQFWPGDVIKALRWLEDRALVERHERSRGFWRVTPLGLAYVEESKVFTGGAA